MNSKHPETLLNVAAFTAESDFSGHNKYFEARPLQDLLQWGLATFGQKLVQVTSFGATGMVILDHLAKLNPGMRVVTIDTGFLFEETYTLMEEIQRRYPVEIEVRRSRLTPKVQSRIYRPELWQTNPDLCCHVRKVVPLTEVLLGCEAWITGMRRDQAKSRTELPLITWDAKYGMVKLNPLAGWSRGQVWRYILDHKVPYNPLHDQGYGSIGCHHCTRPSSSADERSGRWQGLQKVECGIHV